MLQPSFAVVFCVSLCGPVATNVVGASVAFSSTTKVGSKVTFRNSVSFRDSTVGLVVGKSVTFKSEGTDVSFASKVLLRRSVGDSVAFRAKVGSAEGDIEGTKLGKSDGKLLGITVGTAVGAAVVGCVVGASSLKTGGRVSKTWPDESFGNEAEGTSSLLLVRKTSIMIAASMIATT